MVFSTLLCTVCCSFEFKLWYTGDRGVRPVTRGTTATRQNEKGKISLPSLSFLPFAYLSPAYLTARLVFVCLSNDRREIQLPRDVQG